MNDTENDYPTDIYKMNSIVNKFSWLSNITQIFALVTSLWTIYLFFANEGILLGIISIILLSMIFKFGVAPMFAISASILSFYFDKVGIWLPIVSYIMATILFFVDIKLNQVRKNIEI